MSVNYILYNATEDFGLNFSGTGDDTVSTADHESTAAAPALGIWNGESFVFTQSSSNWWWDTAKLLWKYGLAPIRTNNLMKQTITTFLKMYDAPVFPFRSLGEAAYDLGLTAATAATGKQYLKEHNIGDAFANDIVQAATRVNYAQNLPLIHGLETMACMATDGAVSIKGGNWQIFDHMVRNATSDVRLETNVTAVVKQKTGDYMVHSKLATSSAFESVTVADHFDEVVLAAPYQFSGVKLDCGSVHVPTEVSYVKLHVTLFTSPFLLSPAAFNLPPDGPVPEIILTTLQENEKPGADPHYSAKAGFFSISLLQSIQNPKTSRQEFAYKIFSPMEIDDDFLAKILGVTSKSAANSETDAAISKNDVTWIYRKIWHSYPYEYPRVTFEELRLDGALWYTAGMENLISTMETNALMGKNIARLVVDEWLNE